MLLDNVFIFIMLDGFPALVACSFLARTGIKFNYVFVYTFYENYLYYSHMVEWEPIQWIKKVYFCLSEKKKKKGTLGTYMYVYFHLNRIK